MFGVDLTWLGWIFIIDMMTSAVIHLFRAAQANDHRRTPGESFFIALFTVLYIVGFFTVGFVN